MEKEAQLLSRTLEALRPNAEYSLSGNDIKDIVWATSDVQAITKAEYDAEYKKQSNLYAENQVKAEQAKTTAQAKLAALGLTAYDLKALGLEVTNDQA